MVEWVLSFCGVMLVLNRNAPGTGLKRFEPDFLKIRCPLCQWRPGKADRWLCSPGCEQRWNTFETAGICPGCAKNWTETACLRCAGWSLHDAWYEHGDD